jgi:hypothetical protein
VIKGIIKEIVLNNDPAVCDGIADGGFKLWRRKMKGNGSASDSFLYGSGAPQSSQHETRFAPSNSKSNSKNKNKRENSKNKLKHGATAS